MSDVMKKRLTGLAILILIAIMIPVLMSRCAHRTNDDSAQGSMRVYTIQPNGQAEPVEQQDNEKTAQAEQPAQENVEEASDEGESEQANRVAEETNTTPVRGKSDPVGANELAQASQQTPGPSSQRGELRHNGGTHEEKSPSRKPGESSSAKSSSTSRDASAGTNESRVHGWVVQVASFAKSANAKSLADKLSDAFQASYSRVSVDGKPYYHVYVGPYNSKDGAHSAADRLSKAGHGALVRHLP